MSSPAGAQGWSYDGETVGGRFKGAGILTTDTSDRFEGQWADGKMTGFGVLRRANGERYAGDWKDDKPNGSGELRHADGTKLAGTFIDGKLVQAVADTKPVRNADQRSRPCDSSKVAVRRRGRQDPDRRGWLFHRPDPDRRRHGAAGGSDRRQRARKTTFTFMTDRMGTVVEDSGAPSAGSSVTGFFRLTGKGVEIRYSDGRSAMLAASADGGVQMALDGDAGPSCRAWYPAGHSLQRRRKESGAERLCQQAGPGRWRPATPAPAAPPRPSRRPPTSRRRAPRRPSHPRHRTSPKAKPERACQAKAPARMAKASYRIGDYSRPQAGWSRWR